jgi:glutamate carboxypeptidase
MTQLQEEQIERLRSFLESQQPQMVGLLRQLVEAESPSSDPSAQETVMGILSDAFSGLDYHVQLIPGQMSGGQLMAWPEAGRGPDTAEPAAPRQLLIGHCDTVWKSGTLATMPFQIKVDQIQGPGVYDMKGGLVQMIFALKALKAEGWTPAVMPLVCINSDEELGSPDLQVG